MQRSFFCFKIYLLILLAGIFYLEGFGQKIETTVKVPTTVFTVNVKQELQLGAFTQGSSGGSISISPEGVRTGLGTVLPLNFGVNYAPLILEIQGPRGSVVSMLANETVLTGSNGGTMNLTIQSTNPQMPIVITDDPPEKVIIKIGAVLRVGNSLESPPGNYSGSLNISFILE